MRRFGYSSALEVRAPGVTMVSAILTVLGRRRWFLLLKPTFFVTLGGRPEMWA